MKSLKRALRFVGRKTKDLVKACDQAPHPVTFSYDDETEYSSLVGGIFALIVGIFIALVFFSSLGAVLSREQIKATQLRKVMPEAGNVTMPLKRGMMFAIGVEQLDFRYEKVFDLRFSRTNKFMKPRNQTQIRRGQQVKLVPCTAKTWDDLGLGEFFQQYSMNQMLCPDPNEIMKLSEEKGYRLQMEQCGPEAPQPASVSAYIDQINNYFQGFDSNPSWTEQLDNQFDLTRPQNGGIPDMGDSLGEQEQEYYEYEDEEEDENGTYYEQQEYYDENGTLVQSSVPVTSDDDSPPSFDSIPCYYNFYKKVFKLPRQYKVQFYYVNSLINADQTDYFKRYVDYQEFTIELTNHSMIRTEAELTLASYEVSTNNDLIFGREFWEEYKLDLEFNVEKRKGVVKLDPIITNSLIYDPEDIVNASNAPSGNAQKMNNYFTLDIKRSNEVLYVKRDFKTIASIISELGGLITFFGIVLAIIALYYNELCFNLAVISKLYYSEKNQPLKIQKVNYFYFLIYRVYCGLDFIGCEPNWKFCQEWKRIEQNAAKLLDIQTVVKKVQHLEKVGLAVLDEDQYFALYLQEPHNLGEEDERSEAEAVYQKLRAKYFKDGEITEEGRNKLRMAMAMNRDPQVALKEELDQTPQKYQSSGNIMIHEKSIEGFKVHDLSQLPKSKEEDEDEEDRINSEMLDKLKSYLIKLKAASKTSEVAARIYHRIDFNVRAILLNEMAPTSSVIQIKTNEYVEQGPTVMQFIHNDTSSKSIPKTDRR